MLQVKQVLDEVLEKLPDEFNVQEMMARVEDRTPYTVVAFQECERMNILTSEIKRSLKELDLGLKVSSTAWLAVLSNEMLFWPEQFAPCIFVVIYHVCPLLILMLEKTDIKVEEFTWRLILMKILLQNSNWNIRAENSYLTALNRTRLERVSNSTHKHNSRFPPDSRAS